MHVITQIMHTANEYFLGACSVGTYRHVQANKIHKWNRNLFWLQPRQNWKIGYCSHVSIRTYQMKQPNEASANLIYMHKILRPTDKMGLYQCLFSYILLRSHFLFITVIL